MASRKAKARAKRSNRDVQAAARDAVPEVAELPPVSGAATVEVHALNYAQMMMSPPPAPPTTVRALEDLAATVEMPVLGSLGPRVLVMDAAEAVIADRGFGPNTVKDTSEWAGISTDVFHAHFNDERALLVALAERFIAQATTTIDDAVQTTAPVENAVRGVVDLLLGRAALIRAILVDRTLADDLRGVGKYLGSELGRTLEDKVDATDVAFAAFAAIAVAQHAIVFGTELSIDHLAGRAAAAAIAYLSSRSR